jgi:hypothetical protein
MDTYRRNFEEETLPALRLDAWSLGVFLTYTPNSKMLFVTLYNERGEKMVYYPRTKRAMIFPKGRGGREASIALPGTYPDIKDAIVAGGL